MICWYIKLSSQLSIWPLTVYGSNLEWFYFSVRLKRGRLVLFKAISHAAKHLSPFAKKFRAATRIQEEKWGASPKIPTILERIVMPIGPDVNKRTRRTDVRKISFFLLLLTNYH